MTDKQLTEVSDIFKPRYKVIADYPDRQPLIGAVLIRSGNVSQ